jgi:hypothetical protein
VKPLIQTDSISSDEMLEVAPLFPAYEVGKVYKVGDIFTYKRSLYEVIQAHTSQADWPPDTTASLYKNHTPVGEIEEWRQPLGAHDAYMTGDRVKFGGEVYISKIDNNVWSPDTYGWELEASGDEYPKWVQPTGAMTLMLSVAIVTHNGQLWISTVESKRLGNRNIWWSTFEA